MRLLLDTHIAIWLVKDQSLLRPAELDALKSTNNDLFLSTVSIWEMRLKWQSFHISGDRKGPVDPKEALAAFRILELPIVALEAEIAAMPLSHPINHQDPFDELLLVHAQELGLKLFTRDEKLAGHALVYDVTASPR